MRESFRFRFGLALALIPLVGQFLVVFLLGVNTPVVDEFAYLDFVRKVREGGEWLPMVWNQHNEHRVVPVKLTMVLLSPFVGWNPKAEMYVSAVLAGLIVLGLWRLYRRAGGSDLLLFAPASWLFCNLAQYENMLYGLQMCHYYTVAGVVWALVFLSRRSWTGLALAVLCALVASLSVVNGLLVWPVGLFMLLALEERLARAAAWAGSGAAAFILYFFDFTRPPGLAAMHLGAEDLPRVAHYAIASLGAPFAAGSAAWAKALGLAMLVLVLALAVRWLRQGRARLRDNAVPAALLLFGLLSCGLIAGGRALAGVPPLQSRYVTYTVLAFLAAYLLAARTAERSGAASRSSWFTATLALLAMGILAANLQGLYEARLWRLTRVREQFLLQTFDDQPDSALGHPGFAAAVRHTGPYLRAHRLSAFSEPQRVLLLTQWEQRQAAGMVLPGNPIEQRLVCPVDELWDVAVLPYREGPPDSSSLTVSIWIGGRRVASRDLPVSALGIGWVELMMPEPLRGCRGQEMLVRIESPDASPATRLGVLTFPSYYKGELRQTAGPLAPGRSLGLSLNGRRFGFL